MFSLGIGGNHFAASATTPLEMAEYPRIIERSLATRLKTLEDRITECQMHLGNQDLQPTPTSGELYTFIVQLRWQV